MSKGYKVEDFRHAPMRALAWFAEREHAEAWALVFCEGHGFVSEADGPDVAEKALERAESAEIIAKHAHDRAEYAEQRAREAGHDLQWTNDALEKVRAKLALLDAAAVSP